MSDQQESRSYWGRWSGRLVYTHTMREMDMSLEKFLKDKEGNYERSGQEVSR